MKYVCQMLIRLYQKLVSPLTKPHCKYYPTCSAYALAAYGRFGFIKGTVLSLKRILRCNPWARGGYDPVPESYSLFSFGKSKGKRTR